MTVKELKWVLRQSKKIPSRVIFFSDGIAVHMGKTLPKTDGLALALKENLRLMSFDLSLFL